MKSLSFLIAVFVSVTSACDGSGTVETVNEGTFAIVTHTLDGGCDGDPDSVIDQYSHSLLDVQNRSIFGVDFVSVVSCVDADDCVAKRDQSDPPNVEISESFDEGTDTDGFTASTIVAGIDFEGRCTGQRIEQVLEIDDSFLRITSERTPEVRFSPDGDGFCTTETAIAVTADQTCGERTIIEAQR